MVPIPEELLAEADSDRRFPMLSAFIVRDPNAAFADAAALLAGSSREREVAAEALGQVTTVDASRKQEVADLLLPLLEAETDPDVLAALVSALGRVADPKALEAVLGLATHPDSGVRFSVASSLPALGLDERSLEALRQLTRDEDADVRDWATFGLAESDADDEDTRRTLIERADDPDEDTRAEALYGLARRHHPSAASILEHERKRGPVGSLVERAQEEIDTAP